MSKVEIEQTPRLRDVADEVKDRLRALEEQDSEARRRARSADRRATECEAKLPGMKRELEKLTAEVLELQSSIRAKREAEAAELLAKPRADLKEGKVGVGAFYDQMGEAKEKASALVGAVDERLNEAIAAIREKGLAILRLEHELWANRADFYYLSGHPSELAVNEIERTVRELSLTKQSFAGRFMGAQGELQKSRDRLDRAMGRAFVAGWAADNLTLEAIRRIPLDPTIPSRYLPTFAGLLAEVEANEKRREEAKQGPGLYFITLTYRSDVSEPWSWIDRKSGSPVQMAKVAPPGAVLTMSDLPKRKGG